ncbi:ribosomal protein L22/L17 [Podospora aff. communis PSN243]|uniref:Ribosomal protein L22/L17 n=1 Tax=Podospora aff. communis PSN243 TaxID=3040156 RepID=A0AAV9GYA5_9PEZI|nr:ribosomal protein L22/L17 [Podospora aff. communis PSN243]
MTLNMPSRRLLRNASALTSLSTSSTTANALLPALQSLSLAGNHPSCPPSRSLHTTPSRAWFFGRKKSEDISPMEKKITGTAEARKTLINRLQNRLQGPAMFQDEVEAAPRPEPKEAGTRPAKDPRAYTPWGASLAKEHIARAADPDPRSRVRWERKMVIRQIRRGTDPFSVEPRAEKIARTERVLRSKSPFLATSVKKLVHLARQVQGKTVEDALVQMKYSKKKMAKEVRVQLERARDLAIAERGMGLGTKEKGEEIKIQTKDGKHLKISDTTRMYVAEAWVGRGPWRGQRLVFQGKGRTSVHKKPSTSISVVLKEEKTRIREHQEREAKKYRQGPWVHLPDRPVTAQRPYYSW